MHYHQKVFKDYDVAKNESDVRFFFGAQLFSSECYKIGVLCTYDTKTRTEGLSEQHRDILIDFAEMATQIMGTIGTSWRLKRDTATKSLPSRTS